MTGRLEGKHAVITGGGRGIGRAIALAYAGEGAAVLVTARSEDQLTKVVAEAHGRPGRVAAKVCDVTDQESVEAMAAFAIEEIGPIDIVVNNAGVHASGQFMDIAPETYAELFDVNVIGAVRVSRIFLPAMVERGWGRLVNMASTAGLFESPGQAPYNTSKHALVGLTKCMALELAPTGVTCNAICPGFVDTPMIDDFAGITGAEADELRRRLASRTPMGRMLQPGEVANLAVYLGSDESSGMTGQTMVISNGMRMH